MQAALCTGSFGPLRPSTTDRRPLQTLPYGYRITSPPKVQGPYLLLHFLHLVHIRPLLLLLLSLLCFPLDYTRFICVSLFCTVCLLSVATESQPANPLTKPLILIIVHYQLRPLLIYSRRTLPCYYTPELVNGQTEAPLHPSPNVWRASR